MESLEDLAFLKVQDLTERDEQLWMRSGYPFIHKTTLQYAERKAKMFDN